MKRTFLAAMTVTLIFALTGCGNDHNNPPPPIATQIFTDQLVDGDILVPFGLPASSGIVTNLTSTIQSVFAGVVPATGDEYRAFLDFPLGGPNGVPFNASIVSATLDIVIDSVSAGAAVPITIELISFPPPLIAADWDRGIQPPLASVLGPVITSADVFVAALNNHVFIDVTPLMVQAQVQALPNFQIRILEDSGAVPGLIEIDDSTGANRLNLAPLLTVQFF